MQILFRIISELIAGHTPSAVSLVLVWSNALFGLGLAPLRRSKQVSENSPSTKTMAGVLDIFRCSKSWFLSGPANLQTALGQHLELAGCHYPQTLGNFPVNLRVNSAGWSPVCWQVSRMLKNQSKRIKLTSVGSNYYSSTAQQTQNICIKFVQHRPNIFDVGPTLYKCYANVLFCTESATVVNLCCHSASLKPVTSRTTS